ncbi:hypothetical protein BDR04DRAFT_1149044 [Suillus decipiens]|nr:hypothetical protein BDR04DRAFT_1149044 [Suillus decipiens]
MSWLDWSVWIKCRPACGPEEVCYLSSWPINYTKRERPLPSPRNSQNLANSPEAQHVADRIGRAKRPMIPVDDWNLPQPSQLAKHITHAEELLIQARCVSFVAPSTETEKALAKIYAGIFDLACSEVSVSDNFFEIGSTSIDAIRLKREGEEYFGLPDISAIQILKHPVLSSLANYVNTLLSKGTQIEEYDPVVPL